MKTKGITPSTIGLILLCIGITTYFINVMNGKQLETKPYLLLAMSIIYLIAVYDIGFQKDKKLKNNSNNIKPKQTKTKHDMQNEQTINHKQK